MSKLVKPRTNATSAGTECAAVWLAANRPLIIRLRRTFSCHYRSHGRALPWRQTRDPYATLVAEVLLQKTGAKPVEEVWRAFMARFPDVQAVAVASVRTLQSRVAVLGLRKRAQALSAAARIIVQQTGGTIPADGVFLRSLPGIGSYTAAAVLSFAHGVPTAVVDVNAARVYSRIAGFQPRTLRQGLAFAQVAAEAVVTAKTHREVNYGVLDLAAQVCRPHPLCRICPCRGFCECAKLQLLPAS